jgi:hypothetical protein
MSQERNHKGPLSAEFCQLDACRYEVRFKGKFCKFIPFHYTAVLTVTGVADGKVYLSGSQRLGPLMGTFSYNAWATQTQFVANYCAKDDHGQFVMSRCCQ